MATGYKVLQETRPGKFESFYWAADRAEAENHADCIRAIFPNMNIVVQDAEQFTA